MGRRHKIHLTNSTDFSLTYSNAPRAKAERDAVPAGAGRGEADNEPGTRANRH